MTDKQYEKRDAAFEDHWRTVSYRIDTPGKAATRAAFNAGWEARKRAEYETIYETIIEQANHTRILMRGT